MEKEELERILEEKIKENNSRIIEIVISRTKSSLMLELKRKEKRFQEALDNLNTNLIKIKAEVEEKMLSIFENMDFVRKVKSDMINTLNSKLKSILSDEKISETIIEITKREIKDNLSDNIKTVVNQILSSISKRLRQELNVTKELTCSIDSEIRHVMRNNQISYELGKRVERRINNLLDSIEVKEGKLVLLTHSKEIQEGVNED